MLDNIAKIRMTWIDVLITRWMVLNIMVRDIPGSDGSVFLINPKKLDVNRELLIFL